MPRSPLQPSTPESTVLVVSSNPETLAAVSHYFSQTGVVCASRQAINPLAELPRAVQALIVFPDDFSAHGALTYLSLVRTRRPDLTLVIVTKNPAEYMQATATNGHPLNAIVLPRSARGWTVLDAMRATLQAPLARGATARFDAHLPD